jgi:hypothetical protein
VNKFDLRLRMFAWDGYSGTSFEVKIREMEKRFEEALI